MHCQQNIKKRHSSCFRKYVCKSRYFLMSWNIYPFQGQWFPTSPPQSHPHFRIQGSDWPIFFSVFQHPPFTWHVPLLSLLLTTHQKGKLISCHHLTQTWSRSSRWGRVYNQEIDQPASPPPQCWYPPTRLYNVTTHNTETWISRKHDWLLYINYQLDAMIIIYS